MAPNASSSGSRSGRRWMDWDGFGPMHQLIMCGDILELMSERQMNDVGGTPGGLGHFLIGFAMACIGGYLLSNQVMVVGSYWSFYGGSTFGITLLPMVFGIAMLFWNGRSVPGWLLTVA